MCGPEIGNKMASGALCAPRPAYERRRPRGQAICRRQSFDRIAREGFHRGTILRPPWKRRVRFPPPPVSVSLRNALCSITARSPRRSGRVVIPHRHKAFGNSRRAINARRLGTRLARETPVSALFLSFRP